MAERKIGKQAVVIGAGMAGLAAAGAIADYFERVIVLERDRLPKSGCAATRRAAIPASARFAGGRRAGADRPVSAFRAGFAGCRRGAASHAARHSGGEPGCRSAALARFWLVLLRRVPSADRVGHAPAGQKLTNLTVRPDAGCSRSLLRTMAPGSPASGVNPPMGGRGSSRPLSLSTRPDAAGQPWRCCVRPASQRRMKSSSAWISIIRRPPS